MRGCRGPTRARPCANADEWAAAAAARARRAQRYMALKLICLGLLWFSATFPLFLFRDRHVRAAPTSRPE
eukprot:2407239-Prymnesium_polylepis.1